MTIYSSLAAIAIVLATYHWIDIAQTLQKIPFAFRLSINQTMYLMKVGGGAMIKWLFYNSVATKPIVPSMGKGPYR